MQSNGMQSGEYVATANPSRIFEEILNCGPKAWLGLHNRRDYYFRFYV